MTVMPHYNNGNFCDPFFPKYILRVYKVSQNFMTDIVYVNDHDRSFQFGSC